MRVTYSDTTAVELLLVHSGNGSLSLLRGTVGLHSKLLSDRTFSRMKTITHNKTETSGSASLTVLHNDALQVGGDMFRQTLNGKIETQRTSVTVP